MKTLQLSIIIGISFLSFVFLMMHVNSYAYTCAVQAPSVTTQYYYLHSDSVFVGTVSSITNYTNHQLNVKFDVEKSWKGSQHPTITTYSLVACGYSLVKGEKYLVFAAGYPLDYFEWATKPFDNAKDEIVLLDSQQFQAQANADEVLYKRLVNARDAISNMMGSKMSQIPISSVGVNDLNFTLDIGIADKKAATPSGVEEYKQKLEEIVGNVPIRVLYSEYATALPEIITQHTVLPSPLQQFKSGISANNVTCNQGLELIFKIENGYPACVKQDTVEKLVGREWAFPVEVQSQNKSNKISADTQQQPYANITINGLKENYTLNEPIVFSIAIEGYGTGCGDTKAIITKENDSQYKSPVWGVGSSCASNTKQNHFKFNALSVNASINQTGNYILTTSFDDFITSPHTTEKKFSVITELR